MAEANPKIRAKKRRALIALARRRLQGAAGGRVAAALTLVLVLGFALFALVARVSGGGGGAIEGLLGTAARALAWLVGAPLALAAARDRRLADRREGIDALAATRGFSDRALEAARALGAMIEIAVALGAPLVGLAVLFAALAGSARVALARLALAGGVAVFAGIAGVTLGGLGAACGRVGRARGGWLLTALVAGPWALAELAGGGAWSIPGALDAVLAFALGGGLVNRVLLLERVHAVDAAGPYGRARGAITEVSLALGPGLHVVLGAPEDGTLALADVVTGARAPRIGQVRVAGQDPARTPALRARIGFLAAEPSLPPAPTVGAAVRLALRARGEVGHQFDAVLDPFGLSALHARRPGSLGFAEARAVELALALTTPAPRLVALVEPLADVAIARPELVHARLRELARAGACVLSITSSPADARALADGVHVLHQGFLARESAGAELAGGFAELAAWTAGGVRALAAALARHPAVRASTWDDAPGGLAEVRVRGANAEALAAALIEAALEADVVLEAIAPASPGLAAVREATDAMLRRRAAVAGGGAS